MLDIKSVNHVGIRVRGKSPLRLALSSVEPLAPVMPAVLRHERI